MEFDSFRTITATTQGMNQQHHGVVANTCLVQRAGVWVAAVPAAASQPGAPPVGAQAVGAQRAVGAPARGIVLLYSMRLPAVMPCARATAHVGLYRQCVSRMVSEGTKGVTWRAYETEARVECFAIVTAAKLLTPEIGFTKVTAAKLLTPEIGFTWVHLGSHSPQRRQPLQDAGGGAPAGARSSARSSSTGLMQSVSFCRKTRC